MNKQNLFKRGITISLFAVLLVGTAQTPMLARAEEPAPPGKVGDQVNQPESLCGKDDRVASTDVRIGRLTIGGAPGCTAWLISNGTVLTAGHCVDLDPDQSGPLLPDGVLDVTANDVVEFNVPASQSNGAPVLAAANNRFLIDVTSVKFEYDGDSKGKDWAVFKLISGTVPHQTRGFFRLTDGKPGNGDTIRITGYGVDDEPAGSTGLFNSQNQTEQTSSGPYRGDGHSNDAVWHTYDVDTDGANSGSPIIWNANGTAIGIHTLAGCNTFLGFGANKGTSFAHAPLANAIDDFWGSNVIHVDKGAISGLQTGRIFQPTETVALGALFTPEGGTLSIVEGSYDEHITINKKVTLTAPVGTVTLGK